MINVVYLVLVMHASDSYGKALTTVTIPQANMAQCQANAKNYGNAGKVTNAYCIVGVMPK
ncbi:hypothetical protein [Acinetobacter phage vB_AbM_WUPSU]|nr:hypothetical protein [Acinetobacter phage vB_AbM_WUPSU]